MMAITIRSSINVKPCELLFISGLLSFNARAERQLRSKNFGRNQHLFSALQEFWFSELVYFSSNRELTLRRPLKNFQRRVAAVTTVEFGPVI
jgi:hypothetical protein